MGSKKADHRDEPLADFPYPVCCAGQDLVSSLLEVGSDLKKPPAQEPERVDPASGCGGSDRKHKEPF